MLYMWQKLLGLLTLLRLSEAVIPNILKDGRLVRDVKHMKDHMEHDVEIDLSQASPTELEFHFFRLHDVDKDNKLDGLEIRSALEHILFEKRFHKIDDFSKADIRGIVKQFSDEMTDTVDVILLEEDLNKDGYLSYVEFSKGRSSDKLWES